MNIFSQLKTHRLIILICIVVNTGLGISSCSKLPSTSVTTSTEPTSAAEAADSVSVSYTANGRQPTLVSYKFPSPSEWQKARIVQTLEGHSSRVQAISFSPDGRLLAAADEQGIIIWQVNTGEKLRTLAGHKSVEVAEQAAPITSLVFSPNGSLLASSSRSQGLSPEKSIILWNPNTGEKVRSFASSEGCSQVVFSPDGQRLIGACGRGIEVWNPNTGEQQLIFYDNLPVEAIALNPQGNTLATVDMNTNGQEYGAQSNAIKLWNLTTKQATPVGILIGHSRDINQISFTPDGKFILSADWVSLDSAGVIRLWDWQAGHLVWRQEYDGESLSLSPDNQLIAGDFRDGMLLDLQKGEEVANSLSIPMQGEATALAFSPDGKTLAWAGKPPTFPNPVIRLWQVP
ncbi:WD40 repeat domain-containing protein [Lyngbya aestuarii]|uniref:WD40 repeat domain-containing protein n=1 Tax=Lyngbya aestuarii TaxID=118322 RepID=UPI00403D8031